MKLWNQASAMIETAVSSENIHWYRPVQPSYVVNTDLFFQHGANQDPVHTYGS